MQFVALIYKNPDSSYGISFPDVPGCVSAGDSLEEVMAHGREALELHLEDGEVPELHSLDELKSNPEFAEEFAGAALVAIVEANPPSRAVKVTITLEETLLKRLDRTAEDSGHNRSSFIAAAVRQKIAEARKA